MTALTPLRPRIVIVGATSAMAEHCARLWLQQAPAELVLLGRDQARLQRVAADLTVRSPLSSIKVQVADFLDEAAIDAWWAAKRAELTAKLPQGPIQIN